jgi:Zn-dependent protease with chaperone function
VNFFERQQAARGTSLRLLLLFALAVVSIVVVFDAVVAALALRQGGSVVAWVVSASIVTLLIIAMGMLTKTIALRSGGSAVAASVGAVPVDPTTTDPALRRYINIVEEMSLASGVPVPRLFVLEREPGINAFAAGYTPADAAITVTGGALQQLNRDELQGVIGHEFSHVLNGDMRLNIRLIGLLNGILLLGLIGLRVLAFGGGGRDRKGGAPPILIIAVVLLVLGFVGQFFASLIKAAVSRQREWLADASAVQFTRQTAGLEGALKKIAGLDAGSQLQDARAAREVSHMLFGEGGRSLSSLFATHPPLEERIRVLDPAFRAELAAEAAPPRDSAAPAHLLPEQLAGLVGTIGPDDLSRGAALSARIPPEMRQQAVQPSTAVPFVLAMLLSDDPAVRRAQLAAVGRRLGARAVTDLAGQADAGAAVPPLLRLPLVGIALPVLAARPPDAQQAVLGALDDLARADNSISVFEYCLIRLVGSYLADAAAPATRSQAIRRPLRPDQARDAALTLLAAVAGAGNTDPAASAAAFTAAVAHLYPRTDVPYVPSPDPWPALDRCWAALDALEPVGKQRLVEALLVAIQHDGVLGVAEAELLRTTCALLHLPVPALVG